MLERGYHVVYCDVGKLTRYKKGKGLAVLVDGREVARTDRLARITATMDNGTQAERPR